MASGISKALAANMASAGIGKVAAALLGLALVALLTRHLGPAGFGDYRAALVFLAMASILANLGLYVVLLRELGRPGADEPRLIGNALALRLTAALAVHLLAMAAAVLLPYTATVLLAILVGIPGYLAIQGSEILAGACQRHLRQGKVALAETLGLLVTLTLSALAAALGAGVVAMAAAFSVGLLVQFALLGATTAPLVDVRPRFEPAVWRPLAAAGLPIAAAELIAMILLRGDLLLLSLLHPGQQVGFYALASKLFELVLSLAQIFAGLMMPLLAGIGQTPDAFRGQLGEAVRHLAAVILVVPLAFLFYGHDLAVLLAGPAFAGTGDVLGLIGLAVACTSLSLLFRYAAVALEGAGGMLRVDSAVLAVALVLYPALVWPFGFKGAAAGTLVVNGLTLAGAVWVVRGRLGGLLPGFGYLPLLLLAALAMAVAATLLKLAGLHWIPAAAISVAVYAAACLGLGVVRLAQVRALVGSPGA
jgi:O-antigen/teichoic acid export membrane protein